MGWHTGMRNHLHPLMKQKKSVNYAKPFAGRAQWIADLGPWYGSSNRVNMVLKPWVGMGESGSAQRLPARIKYHM